MIKRLRVMNFRSLKEVTIEPGAQLTVLVGPNASGKTNVREAFKFLTHIAGAGLTKALLDRGGFQEIVWKGDSSESTIALELVFENSVDREHPPILGRYELKIDGSLRGLINVSRELLTIKSGTDSVDVIDLNSGHGVLRNLDGSKAFDAPGNPTVSALEFNVPNWVGTQFKQYLQSWYFYSLIPALMKQVKPFGKANFLGETGDNLVEYLTTLKTAHSGSFRRIEQVVKDCFPGIEELIPETTQHGQVFLTSREKYLRRPITVWNMADGQLAFMALLALILSPLELGSPLIWVEEPENHLHPRLLETLVEILRQRQQEVKDEGNRPAQVFLTTHSPYLIDQVQLDELVVLDKSYGQTRCFRPKDKKELQELLSKEDVGLGELWFSGTLGGV